VTTLQSLLLTIAHLLLLLPVIAFTILARLFSFTRTEPSHLYTASALSASWRTFNKYIHLNQTCSFSQHLFRHGFAGHCIHSNN
jgi:hypothetical protein